MFRRFRFPSDFSPTRLPDGVRACGIFFAERRSGNDRKVPPRLFISCLCIIITGKILSLSRETSRPTRAPGPEKIGGKARKGAMGLNSGTLLKFCPFFRKRFVYGKEIFYLILIDCYIFLQGMALSVLAGSPFRPAPGPGGTENKAAAGRGRQDSERKAALRAAKSRRRSSGRARKGCMAVPGYPSAITSSARSGNRE